MHSQAHTFTSPLTVHLKDEYLCLCVSLSFFFTLPH